MNTGASYFCLIRHQLFSVFQPAIFLRRVFHFSGLAVALMVF
jgi:hypothetical protein